jgi:hypothetical protein
MIKKDYIEVGKEKYKKICPIFNMLNKGKPILSFLNHCMRFWG